MDKRLVNGFLHFRLISGYFIENWPFLLEKKTTKLCLISVESGCTTLGQYSKEILEKCEIRYVKFQYRANHLLMIYPETFGTNSFLLCPQVSAKDRYKLIIDYDRRAVVPLGVQVMQTEANYANATIQWPWLPWWPFFLSSIGLWSKADKKTQIIPYHTFVQVRPLKV